MNKFIKFAYVTTLLCLMIGTISIPVQAQQAKSRKHTTKTSGVKKKPFTGKRKKDKEVDKLVFVPTASNDPVVVPENESQWKPGDICLICENNPGLCPYCNGSGKQMVVTTVGTQYISCEKCSGKRVCPICKGQTAKIP